MKPSELLTLCGTIVGTGVAIAVIMFDLIGDLRAEVRMDIGQLRVEVRGDIHALREAQTRTESRLTRVEEQLGSVRTDLHSLKTDVHSLKEAQARTESRVAHVEGQLVQLNLIARTADASAPGEEAPSPGQ